MLCDEEKITLTALPLLRPPSFGVAVLRLEIALLALLASLVLPAYGVVLIDPAIPTTLSAALVGSRHSLPPAGLVDTRTRADRQVR